MKSRVYKLGDCCQIVSGATPKTDNPAFWDGDIMWVTPKDLSSLKSPYISETPRKITVSGLKSCAATVLPVNSVLFSSRAPIGHVAINTVPMCTNQGFKSFVPAPEVLDSKFLYHWLKAHVSVFENLGNGATFKEVSKATVSSVEISLPRVEEQRRIAEVLDRADTLQQKRRLALQKLDSLLKSVFFDMFGDPHRNSNGWDVVPLESVTEEFRYGTSNKSSEIGYPALRIPNVVSEYVDLSDLKTVAVTPEEFQRLKLLDGDVLFVRTNGNPNFVGRTAVFSTEELKQSGFDEHEFIYASYLIRARLDQTRIVPRYLQHLLMTQAGRNQLRSKSKTSAGQFNINTEGLGKLEICLPPLSRQQRFDRFVTKTDLVRVRLREHELYTHQLFGSLQQRAFDGRLFPHRDRSS